MKKGIRKFNALFLSVAMMVTMLPKFSTPVFAQDIANELPIDQFATVEQLKLFNTDDTNDGTKNPAKVYFGNNNQQWWIAGSQQEHGLTLFAASPLATGQQFEPNLDNDKTYDSSWDCTYQNENAYPSDVYPNHYGASALRKTLQNMTDQNNDTYFSESEQALMKVTTVYTNDEKYQDDKGEAGQEDTALKKESVYSTADKLYLPYGDYQSGNDNYITVGNNSLPENISTVSDLNNGLRVDMDYWGSRGAYFWLRAPYCGNRTGTLVALPGRDVDFGHIGNSRALVPAFELNLSNVSFASAVPASSGNMTLQDVVGNGAFTLRYDASKYSEDLGQALVSYDKSKVTLTNVPNGAYLVVQNKDGAKAKQITNETEVSAKDDFGLDSFENCKIWLETTDTTNRMTYATLAEEITDDAIAKVVKEDGTEVFYSDIVDAFAGAENSTLYLLDDVEYDRRADSQFRILAPAKNMILNTNNYTLTCDGFYQSGWSGNFDLTIIGNGKDKIAVKIIDTINEYDTTISNAKIAIHSISNCSFIVESDSSVEAINLDEEAPYLVNGANLYLEDGAELIGKFEQPYDSTKIYTNVQSDKSKYKLEVPTNLELGKTYDLKLSEVFLNHSDIVKKGKMDVSVSGMDESGYITMNSTGNHTVYLPISIDNIDSLTNDTVILSAEHRNPEQDEAQHYNGNGHDSAKLIIGNEMFYIPDNPGEAPTKADLNHEVYSGTLTLSNNIDGITKTINMVYDNRLENTDLPNVSGDINLIRGTDGRMEYATSETSDTWITCDADSTKVEAGTYYVRYKETDTFKASKPVEVVVVAPEYKISTSKENVDFGTKHIGYEDINSESLEISNTGNVDVSNIKVSLTGTNKDSFTVDTKDLKISLKPNQKTSFTVVPNDDLDAGTYTTQIEITADSNIKKVIDIHLTVEGHEYESVVTPPTCTSKGYTTHTCTICNHSYTDSETEMLPHDYKEEWKSNETEHWHECECGAISDEATHAFKWVVDKEATEKEKGSKHEECSICGYKKASVEIPVLTPTNPEKPNTDKPSEPTVPDTSVNGKTPETGDQENIGRYMSLAAISVFCIAVLGALKKKRNY